MRSAASASSAGKTGQPAASAAAMQKYIEYPHRLAHLVVGTVQIDRQFLIIVRAHQGCVIADIRARNDTRRLRLDWAWFLLR
jgi:hypothetical protein